MRSNSTIFHSTILSARNKFKSKGRRTEGDEMRKLPCRQQLCVPLHRVADDAVMARGNHHHGLRLTQNVLVVLASEGLRPLLWLPKNERQFARSLALSMNSICRILDTYLNTGHIGVVIYRRGRESQHVRACRGQNTNETERRAVPSTWM